MNLVQQFHEAFGNLLTSKLRSLLTLLGVLIGTASVVALVSSGELATQHALAQFKTLGTDLLAVSINPSSSTDSPQAKRLHLSDVTTLAASSSYILQAAPYTNYYATISYNGNPLQGSVIGATEALQEIAKIDLAQGRFISYLDKTWFFCVIGNNMAQRIRSLGVSNPMGTQIRVGENYYTIVGIAKPWPENIFLYADVDNALIIPIENSFALSKYVQIQNIIFKLRPHASINQVQSQVTSAINSIVPKQQLFFRSAKQLIVSLEKQRQTLTLLLALIGSISLVVGGIGVMNIMLVSVIERKREIGIRMAIGATRRDIGLMFITEAVVLTLFGGVLGILIGVAISFVTAELSHWTFQLYLLPPLVGFLVSALVGMFFGFYPAFQASRLNPIETLRSE